MLTARELPPDEWWRLDGTELGKTWRLLPTDKATVVVVENEDGQIVGTWSVMLIVHTEGLGVAPPYQSRGRVARLLLREGAKVVRRLGASQFVTGAATMEMVNYLDRLGGVEIPARFFSVPLDGPMARVTKERILCQPQ